VKLLVQILRLAWRVYSLIVFVLLLIIQFPVFYFLLYKESRYPQAFKLMRFFALVITFLSGIRNSVKKDVDLKNFIPCIYCSNHASYLDIVMSYRIIPYFFIFMGKQELAKITLFTIFFKKMNILVDRDSKIGSHRAFIRAGHDIDKGYSIMIFAEGGIPDNAPTLNKFKNGPFKLAIDKQIPIIPITFVNNWKIIPDGKNIKIYGGPATSYSVIHEPIVTKGMTEKDLPDLREKVFDIIYKTLNHEN